MSEREISDAVGAAMNDALLAFERFEIERQTAYLIHFVQLLCVRHPEAIVSQAIFELRKAEVFDAPFTTGPWAGVLLPGRMWQPGITWGDPAAESDVDEKPTSQQVPAEFRTKAMTMSEAAKRLKYSDSKANSDAGRKQVDRDIKSGKLRAEKITATKWYFDKRQVPDVLDE